MKIGIFLAISAISMIANAGGSVVSGGRGAVIYCSQKDASVPFSEIVLNPNSVGHLNVEDGEGNQCQYLLFCERAKDQPDNLMICEHKGYYTVYITDYAEAVVINNRGLSYKMDCQLK